MPFKSSGNPLMQAQTQNWMHHKIDRGNSIERHNNMSHFTSSRIMQKLLIHQNFGIELPLTSSLILYMFTLKWRKNNMTNEIMNYKKNNLKVFNTSTFYTSISPTSKLYRWFYKSDTYNQQGNYYKWPTTEAHKMPSTSS